MKVCDKHEQAYETVCPWCEPQAEAEAAKLKRELEDSGCVFWWPNFDEVKQEFVYTTPWIVVDAAYEDRTVVALKSKCGTLQVIADPRRFALLGGCSRP